MNRIVIALMQELDRLPNNVIIIGTTNRHDRLDDALLRRFYIHHEVLPLDSNHIFLLADKFFTYIGYDTSEWVKVWCNEQFGAEEPAATVISKCTDKVVADIISRRDNEAVEAAPREG